jgi:hypothetical protein
VLPHFVLRYRRMSPDVARHALIATHGGLSLEWCATIYNISPISNRAASSKYTLYELSVGCKPHRWLESMVPERANSVYGIYALT